MTVGEKIKYYRNIRGISQEMLGNLSGINPATIKKYEYGIRNPKPDQLLKITTPLALALTCSWILI
ncbi:MAG: helix-turn-helix domain-containing protein [Enterocloster sp.]